MMTVDVGDGLVVEVVGAGSSPSHKMKKKNFSIKKKSKKCEYLGVIG
jgi:hypothetical protein